MENLELTFNYLIYNKTDKAVSGFEFYTDAKSAKKSLYNKDYHLVRNFTLTEEDIKKYADDYELKILKEFDEIQQEK